MRRISECEEQTMIVVWSSKNAPDLQTVLKSVNVRFEHAWAPQTVSTFLNRLIKKGYLRMERKGRYCYYYPKVALEEYREEKLRSIVDVLFDGDQEKAGECLRWN